MRKTYLDNREMFKKGGLPYSVVKSKPKLSKNLSEQRKKLHFELDWLRVRQESSRPIRWRSEAKPKKPILLTTVN